MIRPVEAHDAAQIAEIYNHYVANSVVTFEEEAITADEVQSRIDLILGDGFPWIVFVESGNVLGYSYAMKWRKRAAYRFTCESAIYLDQSAIGKGIGTQLYQALFDQLQADGIRSVMGMIALPNPQSISIHEKFGFVKVAEYSEVGWKFDGWIDVGCWQLKLKS
jgi:phosphinothricin acetyltransferase